MTSSGAVVSAQEVMSHCVGRQLTMTTTSLMMAHSQYSALAPQKPGNSRLHTDTQPVHLCFQLNHLLLFSSPCVLVSSRSPFSDCRWLSSSSMNLTPIMPSRVRKHSLVLHLQTGGALFSSRLIMAHSLRKIRLVETCQLNKKDYKYMAATKSRNCHKG